MGTWNYNRDTSKLSKIKWSINSNHKSYLLTKAQKTKDKPKEELFNYYEGKNK